MTQQLADSRTRARPDFRPQRHEWIERWRREHAEIADVEPAVLFKLPEIEHVIADRNARARRQSIPGRKHAIGQILDRKIGRGVDGYEGAKRGIVGMGHYFAFMCFIIPGCASWRRPGIHNHDRAYGFWARAFARPGMTDRELALRESRPVRIEPLFQSLPAIGVVVLQGRGFRRMRGDALRVARLEHEGHG